MSTRNYRIKTPCNNIRILHEEFLGANYINRTIHKCNMETITINKQAIVDLVKVKGEFDTIVESIELMGDKEFMDSYKKAKEQIKQREFDDWNAL